MGNITPAKNDAYSGYITVGSGTPPQVRYKTGSNETIKISATTVKSGHYMIGILRFNSATIAAATGLSGITSWDNLRLTKATVTLKPQTAVPTSATYCFAIAKRILNGNKDYSSTFGSVNASNMNWLNAAPNIKNVAPISGTGAAGVEMKFDLLPLFKKLNGTLGTDYNILPNTGTIYLFIWIEPQSNGSNRHFYSVANYVPVLTVEGKEKKGGVGYYGANGWETCTIKYWTGSGWQECEARYWDGSDWIPVGGP